MGYSPKQFLYPTPKRHYSISVTVCRVPFRLGPPFAHVGCSTQEERSRHRLSSFDDGLTVNSVLEQLGHSLPREAILSSKCPYKLRKKELAK